MSDYWGFAAPGTSPVVFVVPPLVVVPLPVEPLALPVVVPLPVVPGAFPLVVEPLPVVVVAPLLVAAPLLLSEEPLMPVFGVTADPFGLLIGEPFMSEPLEVEPLGVVGTLPVVPWPGAVAGAPVEEPALPPAPPLEPSETPPVEPPVLPPETLPPLDAPPAEPPAAPPPPAPPPPPPAWASRYWSGVAALILENGRLSRAALASQE